MQYNVIKKKKILLSQIMYLFGICMLLNIFKQPTMCLGLASTSLNTLKATTIGSRRDDLFGKWISEIAQFLHVY